MLSCEIRPSHVDLVDGKIDRVARVKAANAVARFATHEEAEKAVAGLRRQGRGAALLYNETPYEGVGGRGWCLVEQGSASVVAAHLAHTEQLGVVLPPSFALAQRCRPKLIDITGGKTSVVKVAADPERVLRETMDALGHARFTFDSDRAMAEEMMNEFEWIIKMASEQALATVGAKSRFFSMSVDPQALHNDKSKSQVRLVGPRSIG